LLVKVRLTFDNLAHGIAPDFDVPRSVFGLVEDRVERERIFNYLAPVFQWKLSRD